AWAKRNAEIVQASVPVVNRERVDTRIVSVATLGQDVEVLVIQAERRSAIAHDGASGEILEHFAGAKDIVPELHARELRRQNMTVPVGRDLVPALDDLADQRLFSFSHPAKDEECRTRASFGQQVEDQVSGRNDPAGYLLPVGTGKYG